MELLNQACKEYQAFALTTILPQCKNELYLIVGLNNELGEVLGNIKKYLRQDYEEGILQLKMMDELGDVWWYIANLCKIWDIEFEINPEGYKWVLDEKEPTPLEYIFANLNDYMSSLWRYKKMGRYGSLEHISSLFYHLSFLYGIDVRASFDANITKLSNRKEKGQIQNHG